MSRIKTKKRKGGGTLSHNLDAVPGNHIFEKIEPQLRRIRDCLNEIKTSDCYSRALLLNKSAE